MKTVTLIFIFLLFGCQEKVQKLRYQLNPEISRHQIDCISLKNHPVINSHWICMEKADGKMVCYKIFKNSSESYIQMVLPVSCHFYNIAKLERSLER